MRVCGVELKGSEAVLCLLDYDDGLFTVPDCRQRSFAVSQTEQTRSIRDFHFAFGKLIEDYKIEKIIIIERPQKGKLAGTAPGFKIEAAIQLSSPAVELIEQSTIKAELKANPLQIDPEDLDLKKFQIPAFKAAYAYHNLAMNAEPETPHYKAKSKAAINTERKPAPKTLKAPRKKTPWDK